MDASSDTGDKSEHSDDDSITKFTESNNDDAITKEEIESMDWDKLAERAANELDKRGSDESEEEYQPKKLRRIENRKALNESLKHLQKKTDGLPWIETLTISLGELDSDSEEEYTNKDGRYQKPKNPETLKNNDIKREVCFRSFLCTEFEERLYDVHFHLE